MPTVLFCNHLFPPKSKSLKNSKNDLDLGEKSFHARERGYDLATFITFALTDQAAEHGVLAINAADSVRTLLSSRGNLQSLSRVLVVTLGAQATEVNWDDLCHEYIARGDFQ